jgi:integrase
MPEALATAPHRAVTGSVLVEDRKKGRVWVAAYFRADGRKVRKTLGMAWVRESGERTPRGAIVWRGRSGPKPSSKHLTPKEAASALEVILAEERASPTVQRPGARHRTLDDVLVAWLTHSRVQGVSPSTYRSYVSIANGLRERLGRSTRVAALTKDQIARLQSEMLSDGRARSTAHHHLTALRHALEIAVGDGWINRNPSDGVAIVPLRKSEPDFNVLEPSQVEAAASAVALLPDDEIPRMRNGQPWVALEAGVRRTRQLWSEIVRFAAFTGLRMGELRALKWIDVDHRGSALRVARNAPATEPAGTDTRAPKSGRARSVPLMPQALACLERVSKLGHPTGPNDLVFPSLGGGLFDAGRVRAAFYRGLRDAGFGYLREKENPMTFHDLRHTFGTIAARIFPLADVQAYLGTPTSAPPCDTRTTSRARTPRDALPRRSPRTVAERRRDSDLAAARHGVLQHLAHRREMEDPSSSELHGGQSAASRQG